MKIALEAINSAEIRAEMKRDSYKTAELIGTYRHPHHPDSNDWVVTLYYAADSYVFETNGDPVWDNNPDFMVLAAEYGVFLSLRSSVVSKYKAYKPVASETTIPSVDGWGGASDSITLKPGEYLDLIKSGSPETWSIYCVRQD